MFVAAAVITLGLCAVASVATLHEAPQEDSISNVFTGYVSCFPTEVEFSIQGPLEDCHWTLYAIRIVRRKHKGITSIDQDEGLESAE